MPRGRPQRPHKCSWDGRLIEGLYHCKDGRWRINATGQKFTEPDERLAVARFRQWQAKHQPLLGALRLHENVEDVLIDLCRRTEEAGGSLEATIKGMGPAGQKTWAVTDWTLSDKQWGWLRQQLLVRPGWVGERVGFPQLAGLAHASLPRPSIRLSRIRELYELREGIRKQSKAAAISCFDRLTTFANAKALEDLTTEVLLRFREHIESSTSTVQSAASRSWLYGAIKGVLAYAMKKGEDTDQIRAALDRCKVLFTEVPAKEADPQPITSEGFRKLLKASNHWRPWFLMALNACMYLGDLCDLRWDQIKGDKLACRRGKTNVVRCAVLWPETLSALAQIRRKGPYVFTSAHGTKYSSKGRYKDFPEIREKAGLSDTLKFSHIRDAAYTTGYETPGTDERFVRVFVGHVAPGLTDRYLLRNPQVTAPVCEHVRAVYGPFPDATE